MSVLIAGISSGILAICASRESGKTKQARDNVESLRKIPEVSVAGLRTLTGLLPHQDVKKLVFVRGAVLPRSYIDNLGGDADTPTSSSEPDTLRSAKTNQEAIVVEERTTHIFHESVETIMGRSEQESNKVVSRSRKQVPFVITDTITKPCKEYVFVNLEGTEYQGTLEKVCSDRKELVNHVHYGSELQVDELVEEEILPLGTVVSALGLFSSENGIPTIKPFEGSPLFLTTKSKEQLVAELSAISEELSDNGRLLTQISAGLAGFAIGAFVSHVLRNLTR